jgi:hypothetical protein
MLLQTKLDTNLISPFLRYNKQKTAILPVITGSLNQLPASHNIQ